MSNVYHWAQRKFNELLEQNYSLPQFSSKHHHGLCCCFFNWKFIKVLIGMLRHSWKLLRCIRKIYFQLILVFTSLLELGDFNQSSIFLPEWIDLCRWCDAGQTNCFTNQWPASLLVSKSYTKWRNLFRFFFLSISVPVGNSDLQNNDF